VGETSLARLLAAPRATRPYAPDRVLTAAGNRVIGLNADFKCEPLWRFGNTDGGRIRRHAGQVNAIRQDEQPRSNQKPTTGRTDSLSSRSCNAIRGGTTRRARARLPRVGGRAQEGVSNMRRRQFVRDAGPCRFDDAVKRSAR
jgi:hypothetical protein